MKHRPGIKELRPGNYLVQVQLDGKRRSARVRGSLADAVKKHAELVASSSRQSPIEPPDSNGPEASPTLSAWLLGRFRERAALVQAETTRRVLASQVRVLVYYLGDLPLTAINTAVVNQFAQRRKVEPPLTFGVRKDGTPVRARTGTLSNTAVNKSLSLLRTALNLAFKEGVIAKKVAVELLPEDDVEPVVPPEPALLNELLVQARAYRPLAEWLPEAIEFAVETGLRGGEQFNLTWRSVEWSLGPNGEGAVRVEEQRRGRLVGGESWRPKNRKTRVVPLSPRARELLETIRGDSIPRADALVFPNTHGSPYVRLQTATKGTGPNAWRLMKADMAHDITWHDLRHCFAVRCLNANVPIATLSAWLGHSDINLTVKRYGRFAAESHEQWRHIRRLSPATAHHE